MTLTSRGVDVLDFNPVQERVQCWLHPNMFRFQTCMTFQIHEPNNTLFCHDYLIIWGWPQRLKPFGQGNYFHEWHIFHHKEESHAFNQAALMMGYNFGDITKYSVVVMSCEKKWSQHHCILYPWLSCPVWMTSTYFKPMGTGSRFCVAFPSPCIPGFSGCD